MRKKGVRANAGLLRLNLVDGVFRFSAFFGDGQNASRGDGFERIAGLRMNHTNVERREIHDIDNCDGQKQRGEDTIENLANCNQRGESIRPAQ